MILTFILEESSTKCYIYIRSYKINYHYSELNIDYNLMRMNSVLLDNFAL